MEAKRPNSEVLGALMLLDFQWQIILKFIPVHTHHLGHFSTSTGHFVRVHSMFQLQIGKCFSQQTALSTLTVVTV